MNRSLVLTCAVALLGCQTTTPCGDGQVDAPEVCDGQVLNGESCTSRGFGPGTLKCQPTCLKFDLTACGAPATCGNGTREGVELCDGAELSGNTCTGLGLGAGTLKCSANCGGFDTSNCGGTASCGNGKVDPGEACDGALLGGATCASLGNDFGELKCLANCSGYEPRSCGKKGTRFASGAKWALPAAGGDTARGWNALAGSGSDVGDFQWATMDLDGDGKPDLVSPSRAYQNPAPSTATTDYPHGWPGDPHWLVFPSTGAGFATGAKWTLPPSGGDVTRGWFGVAGNGSDVGDFQWVTLDVNGDGRPDLVSPSRAYQNPAPSTATTDYPHGWPSDPHWLVFLNSGTGFGTGSKWALPSAGGDVARGWFGVAGSGSDVGDFQWSLVDLNGDGRPDLVSPSRAYPNPAPSTATTDYPHGWPSDPHWLLFINTGTGFGTGSKWTLPSTGGDVSRGWYGLAGTGSDTGDYQWSLLDLNGDEKPDLVSPGRAYQNPAPSTATTDYPHGWPADPHWLFFPNTGSGFGTGAKWTVPPNTGDVTRGWYGLTGSGSDVGDFQWATLDLDGDGRPDLVSYSRAYQNPAPSTATTDYPHGWPGDPHWLLFPNTGSGFGTGAKWKLPSTGGDVSRGWYGLAGSGSDVGDFQWSTLDLNGDGRAELCSPARAYQNPAPSTSTSDYPHGWPGDAHWLVFWNEP